MKKQVFIFIAYLFAGTLFAQTNGFNYKALITNNGNVLNSQAVNIKFTILENGITAVYQETHTTTTDANGIVVAKIGEGTIVSGAYQTIDWGANPYSLKVEIDTGSGYTDFGTTSFKYVPYAKYADKAANVFSGNFADLSGVPAGIADGDDVNDADHNATNELQNLSFDNVTRTLSISNGNSVTIPAGSSSGGDGWGTQTAATNTSINGDGTSGSPLGINTNDAVFNGWDKNASDDFDGQFSSLSNVPAGLSDGDDDTHLTDAQIAAMGYIKNANDADHDASNELQTISKNASNLVTLSNGGGSFTDEDTHLTEAQVDAYVNNNGYLTLATLPNQTDADFYKVGTATQPSAITDTIYHLGNMAIGTDTDSPNDKLTVENIADDMQEHAAVRTTTSGNGDGIHTGIMNNLQGSANGNQYGTKNMLSNTGSGDHFGVYNEINNSNNGKHYGVYNKIQGNNNRGTQYGVYNEINHTGSASSYGVVTKINGGKGRVYGNFLELNASLTARLQTGNYVKLTGNSYGVQIGTSGYIDNSGRGLHYGAYYYLTGRGRGNHFGSKVELSGDGIGAQYGTVSEINNTGNNEHYGVNNLLSGSGSGVHYAVYNKLTGDGIGDQYGMSNFIDNTGNATHYGTRNILSGSGSGVHYANYNKLGGAGTGDQYGISNFIDNTGNGIHLAINNELAGNGTGEQYGINNYILNTGNATHYGTNNYLTGSGSGIHYANYNKLSGTGAGQQYGSVNLIDNTGNGAHFAISNDLEGNGTGPQFGVKNLIDNTGNGNHVGTKNYLSGSGSGAHYASYNRLTGIGTGEQYGSYNLIDNTGDANHYAVNNVLSGSGSGVHYAINNELTGGGTGVQIAVNNTINNTNDEFHYGIKNTLNGNGYGTHYAVYNELYGNGTGFQIGTKNYIHNNGTGKLYGTYNYIKGTGYNDKYGVYAEVDEYANGQHYAIYAKAKKTGSYAGFFKGEVFASKLGVGVYHPTGKMQVVPVGNLNNGGSLDVTKAGLLVGTDSFGIAMDANQIESKGTVMFINYSSSEDVNVGNGGGNLNVVNKLVSDNSGDNDLKAYAYGEWIAGSIETPRHYTNNVTITSVTGVTGKYKVTFNSSPGAAAEYIVSANLYNTIGFIKVAKGTNYFYIYTYNTAGVATDKNFTFVVYKK